MTNGNPPDLQDTEPDLRAIPDDDYERGDPRAGSSSSTGSRMLLLLGLLLLAAGGGWYLWSTYFAPKPAPIVAEAPPPPPPPKPAEPAIQHPIETGAPAGPLPTLAESDKPLVEGLASAIERDAIARWMIPQDLVRRIVVTVDNLPRRSYAQRLSPLRPVPGKFTVVGADAQMKIAPQNAARYTPLVRAFDAVNSEKLVALYVRFYPLFQEAYREQGYPNAYFNDRLVEVLDLLIATREMPGQLAIAQPKVLYEYADPALEALPSGQKILLRIGPENAARVKAKLRDIRSLVAKEGAAAKTAGKAP